MPARVLRRLAGRIFGGSCFLCRGAAEALLCAECLAELPRAGAERCPRCALASPQGAVCGRCLAAPPAFDATRAALLYRFPADVLVQALKFRGELALAPLLGELLAAAAAPAAPVSFIVPVPLAGERLCRRGFNQALEIARGAAAAAPGARLAPELCARIRDTAPQLELPPEERSRNVRGAFECPRLVGGAHIAVVDDVMTTGATLEAVAAALKRAGAARVENWVVCRTELPEAAAAGHAA